MPRKFASNLTSLLLLTAASAAAAGDVDYSTGVFIVNEDWYGHQNSTVNYLLPDDPNGEYWHYRVIQSENPGIELGCTNQFGAIWQGRMYLIAKQAKDPGATVTGGRLTVADALTMKVLHQSENIDPDGGRCDGRGFVGIDEHKGYISTSNGVWVLNLDTFEVTRQIDGTANPTPNNLYAAQCGSMVSASGRVFVAHQSLGLLVIDPTDDVVTDTISMETVAAGAAIGSVVAAKDGSLWCSIAKDSKGTGSTLPYLLRVDPADLTTEVVELGSDVYAPSNSWYAWTPDTFCGSAVTNTLYWSGGASSWFSGTEIFSFDVDSRTATRIIDLSADGENWKLYGCSMRLHPLTDEIYMSLYHEFNTPEYITRRYTPTGTVIKEYPMISNYWFPSLPVFPQTAEQSALRNMEIAPDNADAIFDLQGRKVQTPGRGIFIRNGRKVYF